MTSIEQQRVAVVTGGTGGIGTAICRCLADQGHRVITQYRNEEKMRSWTEAQRADGYDFQALPCDVTDYEQCETFIERVEGEYGSLDILVNNAGITKDVTLRKMDRDHWHTVIDSNLNSVFNVTRPAINGMLERGYGRIINISSINGQKGMLGQANYASAKAGMHGFTMSLAQEVARKGITVNTVSPGYIATDMVMAVPQEIRDKIIAQIPVARLGEPDEVAHLVGFLASEKSGFITGANLAINGGQHMG